MVKMRVYELARELKQESKVLIARLHTLGIEVASHQSTLTAAQVEKLKSSDSVAGASNQKVVVRRRPKAEEKPVDPALSVEAKEEHAVELPSPQVRIRKAVKPLVEEGQVPTSEAVADLPVAERVFESSESTSAAISASEPETSPKATVADSEGEEGEAPLLTLDKAKTSEHLAQIAAQDAKLIAEAKAKLLVRSLRKPEQPQRVPQTPTTNLSPAEMQKAERAEKRLFTPGSGATIVRKATLKEVEELQNKKLQAMQPKPAPSRPPMRPPFSSGPRDDSARGGPFPRPSTPGGAPENRYRSGSGPSSSSSHGHSGSQGYQGSQPAHGMSIPFAGLDEEIGGDRSSKRTFGKGKPERASTVVPPKDESDAAKAARLAGPKRKSLSTRELLESLDTEVVDDSFEAARRKSKVYTPTGGGARRRDKKPVRKEFKSTSMTTPRAAYRVVKVTGHSVTVADLAHQMSVKATELIKKLMGQGIMATVNQSIDFDTAALLASDFGFECKDVTRNVSDVLEHLDAKRGEMRARPPIVTVMGHVDHGKTSILDCIRKSKVAEKEAGGITQHIGAYCAMHNNVPITFIDTPGHEAFSSMRARGAKVTDIVILVVAADDGVMPQTVEAISHARDAKVPIIVAINKIDKPNINLDRIMNELSEHGIQSEEWGGENQLIKVSALKGTGIDELLEAILLQAEVLELQANYTGPATATVIEANLDRNRGPVSTVIITDGTLKLGDMLVAGTSMGRVRAMFDHNRKPVQEALPSVPVEIIGLTDVPEAGDVAHVIEDEKVLREVMQIRESQQATAGSSSAAASLEDLLGKVRNEELPRLNLILKADTQGSLEAIADAIGKLNSGKVSVVLVHRAVGGINQSDLSLAETSSAIILGFNVRAIGALAAKTQSSSIIKYYSVIYDLIDSIKNMMVGKLPPVCVENVIGHAEVREAISVPKIGLIAGSSVMDGKITRNCLLRLVRSDIVIYTGKLGSLRRFKEDVKEVARGYECGISIEGYNDIRVGDVLEAFLMEEQQAVLDI